MTKSPYDLSGMIEDVVKDEAGGLAGIIQQELSNLRPVGSNRVSKAEQEHEWSLMRDRPDVLAKFLGDQNASVESAIKYAHMMEEKFRKQGEEPEQEEVI